MSYENLDEIIELDEWYNEEILIQEPEVMPSIRFQDTKLSSLKKYW